MVTNFSMNPKHSHVQGKEEQLILLSIPIQEYRDSKLSKKYRSTTHIIVGLTADNDDDSIYLSTDRVYLSTRLNSFLSVIML